MNLDIILKKLTKKQLRELVLAQELDRKHQLAFAQELDRKHQLAFENLKRIENLKKEDEDEGGEVWQYLDTLT